MIRRRATSIVLLAATTFGGCMPAGGGGPEHGHPPGMTPQPVVQAVPVSPSPVPRVDGFNSALKVGYGVYVAGQMSLDSEGRLVGENDRAAQITQSLANVCALVRAAHGLPADVVRLTFYILDYTPDVLDQLKTASAAVFPDSTAPVVTIVGVNALPVPGALVEVDAMAILHGQVPDHNREMHH
jgi:enamine deaminase RidA (YjgF/YER057c/UK114 family)